ncbi:MAG: hypothetical protein JSR36_03100 [Proteobacteria bacterium]|nr:hypothetical protein [Pseudomonadota bacterium]
MKALWLGLPLLGVLLGASGSRADEATSTTPEGAAAAAAASAAADAAASAPLEPSVPSDIPASSLTAKIQEVNGEPEPKTPDGVPPAKFTTEASWNTAGYNNTEIVYTIIIRSQDSRIIHCSTELHGSYLENGQKISIADRQNSSIFPGQEGKAGNWLGMDPDSGATYKVTCHPR